VEAGDLRYLAIYTKRVGDSQGDLGCLREWEFKHFQQLIRKYALELAIAETEIKLKQPALL